MKAGRKTLVTDLTPIPGADSKALAAAGADLDTLSQRQAQVSTQYGDGLPYDRERLVSEARFYLNHSAEAMLEAGRRLVQLKEAEPHGQFQLICEEQLGIAPRTARVMMQAAIKYLSPALMSKAQAPALLALGKAKLLDLVSEPGEDLAALADGGTVAGLALDDMQSMSSRELRAALVEARKKAADKDKVIAKKDQKLNELAELEERRNSASRDEAEAQQLEELRNSTLAVEQSLEMLLSVIDNVTAVGRSESASLAARQSLDYVVQRLVDSAEARGLALNLEDRTLPLHMKAVHEVVANGHAGKSNN